MAGGVGGLGGRGGAAVVGLEDVRLLGRADAGAGVDHLDLPAACARAHADEHAAAPRVAQRVVHQVHQRLAQQGRVGQHHRRGRVARQAHAQAQAALQGLLAKQHGHLLHQRRQRHVQARRGGGGGLAAREVEQRVEHQVQRAQAVAQVVQQGFERGVAVALGDGMGQQAHGVHRLAQVVAGGGEKAVLLLHRGFGALLGLAKALAELKAFVLQPDLLQQKAVRAAAVLQAHQQEQQRKRQHHRPAAAEHPGRGQRGRQPDAQRIAGERGAHGGQVDRRAGGHPAQRNVEGGGPFQRRRRAQPAQAPGGRGPGQPGERRAQRDAPLPAPHPGRLVPGPGRAAERQPHPGEPERQRRHGRHPQPQRRALVGEGAVQRGQQRRQEQQAHLGRAPPCHQRQQPHLGAGRGQRRGAGCGRAHGTFAAANGPGVGGSFTTVQPLSAQRRAGSGAGAACG